MVLPWPDLMGIWLMFQPLIIHNILQSIEIMSDSTSALAPYKRIKLVKEN